MNAWFRFLIQKIRLFPRARVIRKEGPMPKWVPLYRVFMYVFSGFALLFLILGSGLQLSLPLFWQIVEGIVDRLVIVSFAGHLLIGLYLTLPRGRYFRENPLDGLVLLPGLLLTQHPKWGVGAILLRHVYVLLKSFLRSPLFTHVLRSVRRNTARIVVVSFLTTILIGTLLLTFPAATTDGKGASFIDALFTATSATCVTGLTVRETPTYFSTFGQAVILVLIQLGGLGIMTYSAFVALLIGRFGLGQRRMVQEMLEEEKHIYSMIFYIFKMTFLFEFIGAAILFARWTLVFQNVGKALYYGLFHAVSAFCNAGFSLFPDSLERFSRDFFVNLTVMGLIMFGGLGFLVNHELSELVRRKRRRLSIHTRLVLFTTGALILFGFFVIFFFEFDGVMLHRSLPEKIMASLFQAITPRTAGFNTLPIGLMKPVTLTLLLVLMFIGASPGSTGGGIKTSTFAVLILAVRSVFRGEREVEIDRENIPRGSVRKALAILVLGLSLVITIFVFLLALEKKPYLDTLFETVSAFGTVGLSTGMTPQWSSAGKSLLVLLMFMGRVGPLTMGLALSRVPRRQVIVYPQARVLIG